MYPYVLQSAGLSQEVVFPTPGLEQFATTGSTADDANRGAFTMNDVPYFVNGTSLYSVSSTGTATDLGTIDGTKRVSFATDGTHLAMVVTGLTGTYPSKGYVYTVSGGLVEITDTDFRANGNPLNIDYVDGWFICPTDEKKFIGALADPTSWNGLDFAAADTDPDPITATVVLNNILYMIGSETIEAFSNQQLGGDFPFVRNGTYTDTGSVSPFSVVKFRGAAYFVGGGKNESPAVWQYTGSGSPTKISTEPVESILHQLTEEELSEVFSIAYTQKGHYFVEFCAPERTLCYELTSKRWHERKSRIEYSDGSIANRRHRVNSVVSAYGKLLAGDMVTGKIGEMDIDIYSEYDQEIPRRIATQPFQNMNKSFGIAQLELTVESGVGNSDDTDPQVEMSRSYDGGKTWTDPLLRPMGEIGEYRKRQIWRRLGRASRNIVIAFETTAKVKVVFIQLTAKVRLFRK